MPRGRTGKAFLGGFIGSEVGGDLGGNLGSAVGLAAGFMAGERVRQRVRLPPFMLLGVSATQVYGFEGRSGARNRPSSSSRSSRGADGQGARPVNVRVLELIDEATDSRIELEGNRSRSPTRRTSSKRSSESADRRHACQDPGRARRRPPLLRWSRGPHLEDVADPAIGPEEVLVDIRATALNRADLLQRMGLYPSPSWEAVEIPGLELAGVVVGHRHAGSRCGSRATP